MTLTELRYLVALADHRHFGRAAAACHVSQPTLSIQIRKLEEQLGVSLFERNNRQVTATDIGSRLVAEARQVIAGIGRLKDIVQSAGAILAGPLRLGIIPTRAPYLLPWLLPPLQQSHRQLDLGLTEDLTDILLTCMLDYELDAALVALPIDTAEFVAIPLFDEPFLLACPIDHPLASLQEADLNNLEDSGLMLLSEGHCLRDQAIAICGKAWTDTRFQTASLTTLRHLVAAGHGCTLLPSLAGAVEHDSRIALVRLAGRRARRQIGLVYRRASPRIADYQALAVVIRAALPDCVTATASP